MKETEGLYLSSHPVRHVVEPTTPQRNATLEQTQQTDRLHGKHDRKDKIKFNREMLKVTQTGMSKLQPKLKTNYATSSLRNCMWQTGDKWNIQTSTNSRDFLAATYGDRYKPR